jgi:hypothetical protein
MELAISLINNISDDTIPAFHSCVFCQFENVGLASMQLNQACHVLIALINRFALPAGPVHPCIQFDHHCSATMLE